MKALPALYRAADRHPVVLDKINSVRIPLGLPPVGCAQYERPHVVAKAAMFPDWFGMPAAHWPELECLGFPLPASDLPLPLPVQEFLRRCPRPLVFTTGTLRLRRRFNDYVVAVRQPELSASLLWSWLFQMFHLQFKINQVVDERLVRGAAPL